MAPSRSSGISLTLAAAAFAGLALLFTYPLAWHLRDHVPGQGAGDNASFLWDLAWMRRAFASSDADFFFTRALFYPIGVDLTLHTHTAFHALLAATLLGRIPIIPAQNLLILLSVWLNGLSAFALAYRESRSRAAALAAGVLFAASPFFSSRLLGHFNLLAAYGLPLLALATLRALGSGRSRHAAWAGVCLVLLFYSDYYLTLFALVLAGCLAAASRFQLRLVWSAPRRTGRAFGNGLLVLLAATLLALILIETTGGGVAVLWGAPVSFRGTFNLRTAAGLLGLAWLALRLSPRLQRLEGSRPPLLKPGLVASLMLLVGAAPLLWRAASLAASGNYVTPSNEWRSAPAGLEVLALALPNPRHPLLGSWTQALLDRWGLDVVETTPFGLTTLIGMALAWRGRQRRPDLERWWIVAAVFFVWSLGPFLRVAGTNTGILCPQVLLRLVPLAANARIPGRALVVCQLAAAVLIACWIASVADARRRRAVAALVGLAAAGEFLSAPLPLWRPRGLPIETTVLAGLPAGAVLTLPIGLQDGFGVRGRLDPEAIYAQAVHGRPIVGGAASRVPRSIDAAYANLPVIGSAFRMSSGLPVPPELLERDRRAGREALLELGIGAVLVNRALAGPELSRYPEQVLGLRALRREGALTLYAVAPL